MSASTSTAPVKLPYEQRGAFITYEATDGTGQAVAGEVAFPINWHDAYNLKGRLLTLIDATFTDPQQRKAQKDIVWQAVQSWMRAIEQDAGYDAMASDPAPAPGTCDGTDI